MPFTMSAGRGAEPEIETEETLSEINSEKSVVMYLPANIKLFLSNTTFNPFYCKSEDLTTLRGAACIL